MRAAVLIPALVLAACATTPDDATDEPIAVPPQGECDAAPVQQYVGQRATGDLGTTILSETQSQRFRWIPPRSAVTQDYRPDRVNVVYDDDYVIERIYCG